MKHRGRPRARSAITALLAAATLVAAGCAGSSSSGQTAASAQAPSATTETSAQAPSATTITNGMAPIAGRPMPVSNKPPSPLKIAIIGFANNPFFVNVEQGTKAANAVLSSYNTTVKYIVAGQNIDVPTVNAAVKAAATQGYKGIGFFIAGSGNCSVIKQLTAQGIKLGVYNSQISCVGPSGGVIDYSQDSAAAGQNSAKQLLKTLNGKCGKVGIITNLFSSPSNELRRTAFINGLKGSCVTPVSQGVEAHDSSSETFTATVNYIQSTPDLVAVYCTAGGPFGAASAVKAQNKAGKVLVIGYDIVKENIAALKNHTMYGFTGQDAFGQGYNVAMVIYNSIVTGKTPAKVQVASLSPFVTLANFAAHDPATNPIGAPGTS